MGQLTEGRPWPMGASVQADGVNFAVASSHATGIELCWFDAHTQQALGRQALPGHSGDVWHGFLPAAQAGLIYGFRAHGPWQPEQGQRFNPNKLLLDPWAKEIVSPSAGFDPQGPHLAHAHHRPAVLDGVDNAGQAFKAKVVQPEPFDWQGHRHAPAGSAGGDSPVLYELHVRGFTRTLPTVPAALRGTFAGLAHPAAIAHLQRLGVTALSLLPVHQCLSEPRLLRQGLSNYWGYNTLGFFCPDPRLAATAQPRQEFREMVRNLHAAGFEVLLDVVFNHTPEADEHGPTLSWRGLDNRSWYHLRPGHAGVYENFSGCGNALNLQHRRGLQWVLDCLRYWVSEMGVDGFRFDLAPTLARESRSGHGATFEPEGSFFKALVQDPVLQSVRLIAEPWDVGPSGYQVGHFPHPWLEWNDKFRDCMRAFWLGGDCTPGQFASRLAGSADMFRHNGRAPSTSVNYLVSHDGFTLQDLVSYNQRHNAANLEGNRDGHGHNLSWNCGTEGHTQDPAVLALRAKLQRALLATLAFAQGTPMLAAGAELGHSQDGNNNPYCQDNAISWLDWSAADLQLLQYSAALLALRQQLLPLGLVWYEGREATAGAHASLMRPDLAWLTEHGQAPSVAQWEDRTGRVLGVYVGKPGRCEQPLLILFNASDKARDFLLPAGRWQALWDSSHPLGQCQWREGDGQDLAPYFPLPARSVALLRDGSDTAPPVAP